MVGKLIAETVVTAELVHELNEEMTVKTVVTCGLTIADEPPLKITDAEGSQL